MEIMSTAELVHGHDSPIPIQTSSDQLLFGERPLPMASTVLELSPDHSLQASHQIDRALDLFSAGKDAEPTLVMRTTSRPTMIARLDCTVSAEGRIVPYEIEERPAGMGVIHQLTKTRLGESAMRDLIRGHYRQHLDGRLPQVLLADSRSYGTDDHHVLPVIRLQDDRLAGPVLLRSEPSEIDAHKHAQLVGRSVSTIHTEGDKSYGLSMGISRAIRSVDELPEREQSFVIKPRQGSKAKGISLYLKKLDREKHGSGRAVSYDRINRDVSALLASGQQVICEPFRSPVPVDLGTGKPVNMLLRLMALVSRHNVSIIGGAYLVRSSVLIHGAEDALNGVIICQEGLK